MLISTYWPSGDAAAFLLARTYMEYNLTELVDTHGCISIMLGVMSAMLTK
jgi:hypothetical protein